MEFKKGDKVRLKDNWREYKDWCIPEEALECLDGVEALTIDDMLYHGGVYLQMPENTDIEWLDWVVNPEMLELVK